VTDWCVWGLCAFSFCDVCVVYGSFGVCVMCMVFVWYVFVGVCCMCLCVFGACRQCMKSRAICNFKYIYYSVIVHVIEASVMIYFSLLSKIKGVWGV
jgi:hypothetical protein